MKTPQVCSALTSLLFALLIGVAATSVTAQTVTLRGVVVDAQTNQGIGGAIIVVNSVGIARQPTGSAATGTFEIQGLAAGTYMLSVSHAGYAKTVLEDIKLTAGETKSLEISLYPTVIELDEVAVTASRRPEKVLEAPASISVLYASQIQDRTASTVTDYLASMPAVYVTTSGLITSDAVVRGFNNAFNDALMSLADNRIARLPSLRANVYSLIPTTNEDIERIEVVSGPGSALYGPNSADGVMHILTKSPF
ncbi:MAG: TonB-dependent receptor plug domain-containing protein [Candidatus Poribacteria bacterium]|nr:TonB-dependent receptor plug domain-containing protein [Candidatus Poribacteria bacterium]